MQDGYLVFSGKTLLKMSLVSISLLVATFISTGCSEARAENKTETKRESFCKRIFLESELPVSHTGYKKCIGDTNDKYK